MATKTVKVLTQVKMMKYIQDTYTHEDEAFLEIEKMLDKGEVVIQGIKVLADIRTLVKSALQPE